MFRMGRLAILTAALALVLTVANLPQPHAPSAQPLPGYKRSGLAAPHRPMPIAMAVWFPASGGTPAKVGGNALFSPTTVLTDAVPVGQDHPLVLLSHGSGGNLDQMGWLAAPLVARGAIVVGVNHAGSTSGDSQPLASTRVWDRTDDLSAALDAILADPAFGPRIDLRQITALGFSMGGATALHLAGARMSRTTFASACKRLGDKAPDCTFLTGAGIDISNLPLAWEADMTDPRITAAIAIDAGYGHAMTSASLAAIDIPTLLITLGGPGTPWRETGTGPDGANLAAKIPGSIAVELSPGWHISFLPPCGRFGAVFVWMAGEEPICSDPAGTDRTALHARIVQQVTAFLALREPLGALPQSGP